LFDAYDTYLEISIRGLQLPTMNKMAHNALIFSNHIMPQKRRSRPQNGFGTSGLEKLPKIVNCTTIKEIENFKETMVRVQVE
jgi:hypothetical protein